MGSNNTNSKIDGTIYLTVSYKHINVRIADDCENLLIDRSFLGFIESSSAALRRANLVALKIVPLAKALGINRVSVIVKGNGYVRGTVLSAIRDAGLEIVSIKDITPLPHNGCRPPKKKRY